MAVNAKKPLAIYLKDTNPAHHKYIKATHKLNNKGEILDILKENENGGDLILYFMTNANIEYRKKLGESRLLHLIEKTPEKIYKAPKRDMTLGEYAVQQCILGGHDPAEFLPDSCWIALKKKGSTQFDELFEDETNPLYGPHLKIVKHIDKVSTINFKSSLEELLSGDYGAPKNKGVLK